MLILWPREGKSASFVTVSGECFQTGNVKEKNEKIKAKKVEDGNDKLEKLLQSKFKRRKKKKRRRRKRKLLIEEADCLERLHFDDGKELMIITPEEGDKSFCNITQQSTEKVEEEETLNRKQLIASGKRKRVFRLFCGDKLFTNSTSNSNSVIMSSNNNNCEISRQQNPKVSSNKLLLLLLVIIVAIGQCQASTLTDFDGATFYKAPVNSRIRIACNGSHWSDDSVSLVLWFKGTIERHSVPIYTVDARQKPLNNGARHLVSDQYKGRAKFVTRSSPPYLDLGPLEADDQSEYRCRIDYRSKPRENFLIILFVLVPPKSVQIMDSNGRLLEQIYGPLSEDSDLTLLCLSKGGRPAPAVTWKRRKRVIDDSYLTINDLLVLKQSSRLLHLDSNKNGTFTREQTINYNIKSNGTSQLPSNKGSSSNHYNGQLESLWREWKSWPEFEYLERQVERLYRNNDDDDDDEDNATTLSLVNNATNKEQQQQQQVLVASNHRAPLLRFEENRKFATGSGSVEQLLTLEVEDSITTSVNVLHLSNVGLHQHKQQQQQHHFLQTSADSQEESVSGEINSSSVLDSNAASGAGGRPTFECEASNLHYDLRTLIKLFAPPSLGGSQAHIADLPTTTTTSQTGSGSASPQQTNEWMSSSGNSRQVTRNQVGRQLVEAIERAAFETNMRSIASGSASGNDLSVSVAAAVGQLTGKVDHSNSNMEPDSSSSSIRPTVRQQQQQQQSGTSSNVDASATALSQIKTDASQLTNSSGQQEALSALAKLLDVDPKRQAELANVIYNQLIRPHQLSSGQLAEQQANSQLRPTSNVSLDNSGNGNYEADDGESTNSMLLDQDQKQQQQQKQANPLVRSRLIALDVYFRPLDVKILGPQRPLSAGQQAEFSCTSSGSRPEVRLSWLKNGQLLDKSLHRQINEPNGNVSHSKLSVRLEQQDHGVQLTCRAENEHLSRLLSRDSAGTGNPLNNNSDHEMNEASFNSNSPSPSSGHALEESRTLIVNYAPKVKLELGNKMLSTEIREGNDIYFVCNVESQPPSKEITWLHNERLINETGGDNLGNIIISNNSLVLQRVKAEQRGQYACMAFNSEGITESNRIELRVLHAPTCVTQSTSRPSRGQQLQYRSVLKTSQFEGGGNGPVLVARKRVPLKGQAKLLCQMEANPADLEISWYLDTSNNNNRPNERRLVLGTTATTTKPEEMLSSSSSSDNNDNDDVIVRNNGSSKFVTQLSYLVDESSDYGQLYCFARNSVGEQKRPCLYEILPPEPEEAPPLSCVAANVTSFTVWVACDRPKFVFSSEKKKKQQQNGQEEDEQQSELSFSIELYVLIPQQPTKTVTSDWQQEESSKSSDDSLDDSLEGEGKVQLEANLSLGPLEEPMFSVNNLSPLTKYVLHVRAIQNEGLISQPSIVRFSTNSNGITSSSSSSLSLELEAATGRRRLEPSAEPILSQHHSGLLSALISTRSTNGKQSSDLSSINGSSSSGGGGFKRANLPYHTQEGREQPVSSLISNFWASLSSLLTGGFHSNGGREKSKAVKSVFAGNSNRTRSTLSSHNNNQLMEGVSDVLLIVGTTTLLLSSLAAMFLLHKRSFCRRNSSSHSFDGQKEANERGANAKKENGAKKEEKKKKMDKSLVKQQQQLRKTSSPTSLVLNGEEELMMMMQLAASDNGCSSQQHQQHQEEEESIDLMHLQQQQQQQQQNGDLKEEDLNKQQRRFSLEQQRSVATIGPTKHLISSSVSNAEESPPNLGGQNMASNQSIGLHTMDSSLLVGAHNNSHLLTTAYPYQTGSLRSNHLAAGSCATLDMSRRVAGSTTRFGSMSRNGFGLNTFNQQQQQQQDSSIATDSGGLVYGATPIRVTKSRSSLCFESLLMSTGELIELERQQQLAQQLVQQQQPKQQLRLIQFSDHHIDRRLISDANLQLNSDQQFNHEFSQLNPSQASEQSVLLHNQQQTANDLTSDHHLNHHHLPHEQQQQQQQQTKTSSNNGEFLCSNSSNFRLPNYNSAQQMLSSCEDGESLIGIVEPLNSAQLINNSSAINMNSKPLAHNNNNNSDSGVGSINMNGNHLYQQHHHHHSNVITSGGETCTPTTSAASAVDVNFPLVSRGDNNNLANVGKQRLLLANSKRNHQYSQMEANNTNRSNCSVSRILRNHSVNQQREILATNKQSTVTSCDFQLSPSPLVSGEDESSDSNGARCTWSNRAITSMTNNVGSINHQQQQQRSAMEAAAAAQFEGKQMHFIELIPSGHQNHKLSTNTSASTASAGESLNLDLMNKLLISTALNDSREQQRQFIGHLDSNDIVDNDNNQNQMAATRGGAFNCSSLTSSSIGSSSVKDQLISSPSLSTMTITNTTLSNTESLLNNCCPGKQQHQQLNEMKHSSDSNFRRDMKSNIHSCNSDEQTQSGQQQQFAYGPTNLPTTNGPIISILKNSNSTKYSANSNSTQKSSNIQQNNTVCQCNGNNNNNNNKETPMNLEERF